MNCKCEPKTISDEILSNTINNTTDEYKNSDVKKIFYVFLTVFILIIILRP